MLGSRRADGAYPVWRFEQEPAPRVPVEGITRMDGDDLVAEFIASDDEATRMIREQWTLHDQRLEFTLEASTGGREPVRVGGFVASRE